MYSVKVRDHLMIAHSLKGAFFGAAQNLHGATYIVDAEFKRPELDEHNVVIDIALASRILKEAIVLINYTNLDEHDFFQSKATTTEFLSKYIHGEICKRIASSFKGSLKVTLHESHIASASYDGPVKDE